LRAARGARQGRRNSGRWLAALVACLGLACDTAGAPPAPGATAQPAASEALQTHVLSRAGYGPNDWSRARIERLGVADYLDEQLRPASISDRAMDARLREYPSLEQAFHDLMEDYPLGSDMQAIPLFDLMRAKLLRSIDGRRQLEQVLVDFFFDHFNVYGPDAITIHAIAPYERQAIRPHVLGRFEDMLLAVARSPAMLYYLDNYLSRREGFVFEGEVQGLNENYARELLELHTLGVDGGYDQQDIIEVARAFTGWTIAPRQIAGADGFFFWPDAHDSGAKSVMGELTIPAGGGIEDGEAVLRFLARHPNTAGFLCGKLVARFVDESPPAATVAACTDAYLASDGHLREAMRAILSSPEFLDTARAGSKVKRPIHFVASMVRATGMKIEDFVVDVVDGEEITLLEALAFTLGTLGEPLYQAHPPTGYPDESGHWANGGALVTRFKLVAQLAYADAPLGVDWGTSGGADAEIADAVGERVLPGGVSDATRSAVIDHLSFLALAPQPVRVREAGSLLLSSPDFMRH
jgi:uncharacterized protein (DUF1800 family)